MERDIADQHRGENLDLQSTEHIGFLNRVLDKAPHIRNKYVRFAGGTFILSSAVYTIVYSAINIAKKRHDVNDITIDHIDRQDLETAHEDSKKPGLRAKTKQITSRAIGRVHH